MNQNRVCHSRQTPVGYRTRMPHADQCRLMSSGANDTSRRSCDVCDMNDMNYTLAMVYSPYQEWQNIYDGEKSLERGTIFAELDKPFLGYKSGKGAGCL